jgi:hypothetical protein
MIQAFIVRDSPTRISKSEHPVGISAGLIGTLFPNPIDAEVFLGSHCCAGACGAALAPKPRHRTKNAESLIATYDVVRE